MTFRKLLILSLVGAFALCPLGQAANGPNSTSPDLNSQLQLTAPTSSIQPDGIGEGFLKGTRQIELSMGAGFGMRDLAGVLNHDLAVVSIRYGWTLSGLIGRDRWYRGNWELVGELFGGGQYNPDAAYVIGVTPLLRYTVATGSRWLPFAEGGFGPSFTDISEPDLSSRFEFNIQGGVGTHYFWSDRQAITFQIRYLHLSNAGFERPNIGVNTGFFLIGTTWFF